MVKPLELKDISTEALIESRHKWCNAIIFHYPRWSKCAVCEEVHEWAEYALNEQIPNEFVETMECPLCPLFKPRWCRSDSTESMLHDDYDDYHYKNYEINLTLDPKLAWERAVTGYLVWISIELVKRGVGIE